MSLFSVFLIGIGLSMDACAVSFAKGICLKKQVKTYALKLGLAFGFFQAMMPLIGWWVGTYFESFITAVDHWIAFFLLGFIGVNMIRESKEAEAECDTDVNSIPAKDILLLAVATSIDALAIGISFAFLPSVSSASPHLSSAASRFSWEIKSVENLENMLRSPVVSY